MNRSLGVYLGQFREDLPHKGQERLLLLLRANPKSINSIRVAYADHHQVVVFTRNRLLKHLETQLFATNDSNPDPLTLKPY